MDMTDITDILDMTNILERISIKRWTEWSILTLISKQAEAEVVPSSSLVKIMVRLS